MFNDMLGEKKKEKRNSSVMFLCLVTEVRVNFTLIKENKDFDKRLFVYNSLQYFTGSIHKFLNFSSLLD